MKYTIKSYWRGEYESKYSVKVKEGHVVVKNKSEDLYPEFRNKKVCTVDDTGNLHAIKFPNGELTLEYDEAYSLYLALHMMYEEDGYELKIKEKKIV
jgi:hypothetical protein